MPFSTETKEKISEQQGGKPLHPEDPPPYHYIHIDHDKDNPLYDSPENGYYDSAERHYKGHLMSAIYAERNCLGHEWHFHCAATTLLSKLFGEEKTRKLQAEVFDSFEE